MFHPAPKPHKRLQDVKHRGERPKAQSIPTAECGEARLTRLERGSEQGIAHSETKKREKQKHRTPQKSQNGQQRKGRVQQMQFGDFEQVFPDGCRSAIQTLEWRFSPHAVMHNRPFTG